jgi:hypothetical protein
MLRRIELDAHERKQLEGRRTLILERVRVVRAALTGSDRQNMVTTKEAAMAQRMHLRMMESRLQRIESELRQSL